MNMPYLESNVLTVSGASLIHQGFIVSSQIEMARETEGMRLDRETVERGVAAVLRDSNKGQYFIALQNENPVACLLTIPEWSDWRNGTVLWIHSVYVVPEFRGKGVYSKMYAFLKTKVEQSPDLRGLRLYVDRSNTRAQAVYERLEMNKDHYLLYEWMKGSI